MTTTEVDPMESGIAIVGMACRFPGARTPDEFWRNLRSGVESIIDFTDEELLEAGVDPELLRNPAYVKRGAPLDGMELWDHEFFRFAPREAAIMDPQHRQFLEVSWEALEGAGYAPGTFEGRTGVFAGCGANAYFMFNLLTNPHLVEDEGLFLLRHTGNDKDFLATRVSYQYDLTGPAASIQTACSTSLAAVHTACQSLLSHECDMALAGAASIRQPHRHGYLHREGEILSPDGRCRAFDSEANGTVIGDGVGAVVLRRLEDAEADGDTVWAVIRGTAMNNDGSSKVGYLAPGAEGQTRVVAEALAVAGVEPETIGYVEGHSAGTPIGDAIEVSSLTRAFRAGTKEVGFCGLGSVKTNVGHLDTVSGVAGLIKSVLALRHGEIPPSLHFQKADPSAELEGSPFFIVTERTPWTSSGTPRRAGVSSLGVGGTNVHVVLEEAPRPAPSPSERAAHLLLISARSSATLERSTRRLARHFESMPPEDLPDAAHTLQRGRRVFAERRFVVCRTAQEAAEVLAAANPRKTPTHTADEEERSVVFLLPDLGSGWDLDRLADLYREEPTFRGMVDRTVGRLDPALRDAVQTSFSGSEASPTGPRSRDADRAAGFVAQIAVAEMWKSWGVTPGGTATRGTGKEAAAVLAGELSLEEALTRLLHRGTEPSERPGDDLNTALGDPRKVLLDIGPDPSLARDARTHPGRAPNQAILTSLPPQDMDVRTLDFVLSVLGRLWMVGVPIDWKAFGGGRGRRLALPPYPFEPVPHYIWPGAKEPAGHPGSRLGHPFRIEDEAGGSGFAGVPTPTSSGAASVPTQDLDRVRTALEAEETVREAAVTVREDTSGNLRFVAHVVPEPGRFITVSELRRSLRARLPEGLVPRNFTQLEELPKDSEGAIDVPRLLDPFTARDDYAPPSSPTERTVADVWARLLGAKRVGIHDNFLDAGGHSLLAARALVSIEERTNVRVTPAMLNLHTLEQISTHIDERRTLSARDVEGPPDGVSQKLLTAVGRLLRGGMNA